MITDRLLKLLKNKLVSEKKCVLHICSAHKHDKTPEN